MLQALTLARVPSITLIRKTLFHPGHGKISENLLESLVVRAVIGNSIEETFGKDPEPTHPLTHDAESGVGLFILSFEVILGSEVPFSLVYKRHCTPRETFPHKPKCLGESKLPH